jgi:hypothetical protein
MHMRLKVYTQACHANAVNPVNPFGITISESEQKNHMFYMSTRYMPQTLNI